MFSFTFTAAIFKHSLLIRYLKNNKEMLYKKCYNFYVLCKKIDCNVETNLCSE